MAEQPSGPPADVLVGIAISFDMGWQKREKGHNSLTGHWDGKGLSYSTRCKTCRVYRNNNVSWKGKNMTGGHLRRQKLPMNGGVILLNLVSNFRVMLEMMTQKSHNTSWC